MKTFQIQIAIHNYDEDDIVIVNDISSDDIYKFIDLIKFINNHKDHTIWNWFSGLPTEYDGNYNLFEIKETFRNNFGENNFDTNLIVEFYEKFFPTTGCDRIEDIMIYEVKQISI